MPRPGDEDFVWSDFEDFSDFEDDLEEIEVAESSENSTGDKSESAATRSEAGNSGTTFPCDACGKVYKFFGWLKKHKTKEHGSPNKMSRLGLGKRHVLLAISVAEMLLFSGIIYGWTSLVYILKQEGYFSDLCVTPFGNNTEQNTQIPHQGPSTTSPSNMSSHDAPCYPECLQQDATLTRVYAISVIASQVASLFAGIALDRFGLRFVRICFSTLMATAALLLGFSNKEYPYVYFVYPGMILAGTCANITLLANVMVGNLFGSKRSTVITIITGSFGSSPITFLVQKLLYTHFGVPFQHMCIVLACLCVPSLLASFTLFPKHTFDPDAQQKSGPDCPETERLEIEDQANEEGSPAQEKERFLQVVTSPLYLLHLAYISVMNLNVIILLGTANIWFNVVTDNNSEQVSFWTVVFGLFQVCNVLVSPLCGYVYDVGLKRHSSKDPPLKYRRRAAVPVFIITSLTSSLVFFFAILSVWNTSSVTSRTGLAMTSAPDMFLTFVLHIISRAFVYGGNTTFIANSFPSEHLGRLIGLSYLMAGLVGLLQYPLIGWIKATSSPFYVYVFILVLSILTLGYPIYIKHHCKDKFKMEDRTSSAQSVPDNLENNLELYLPRETCV